MATSRSIWSVWIVYLNGYVPNLQVGGQVVRFMKEHLGQPIPSPAIFNRIGVAFRRAVTEFAEDNDIPVVRFKKGDRRIDLMRPYLDKATAPAVAAIGVAQEFQWVFSGYQRPTTNPGAVCYGFDKAERRVTCFYLYVVDPEFGPGFVKLCSYFPYPVKVWLNGQEWAKRQAAKAGLAFTELANGFAACDDPAALQAICDRLGPADIEAARHGGATDVTPPGGSARSLAPAGVGVSCLGGPGGLRPWR